MRDHAALTVLPAREVRRCLRADRDLELVHRLQTFDYVIGHADLFPIMFRLRLAGFSVPFAIIPDFNHVEGEALQNLFLASQVADRRDVLFTGSQAAARSFGAFGFGVEGFYPLGVPLEHFTPTQDKTRLRTQLGLEPDPLFLIYAGRLQEDKSVDKLIRMLGVVRRQCECRLIVAYHLWDEEYRVECRRLAEASGGVRLFERPSFAKLRNLYRSSDLFATVAVSRHETFGRAAVEAMACGAVPVLPRYDGFAEIVQVGSGYLLPLTGPAYDRSCDLDAFAEMVVRLARSPLDIQRAATESRTSAARYDARAAIRRAYDVLVQRSGMPPGPAVQSGSVSLAGYPEAVRTRMRYLEGQEFANLVNRPPNQNTDAQADPLGYQEFLSFWFAHY